MEFRRVLFRSIQSLPKPLRGWAATLLSAVAPAQWDAVLNGLRRASAGRLARGLNADKLHKLSTLLASPDQRDFYRQLSSHWSAPEALVRDARSEEHTSELQSLMRISYAVFCLKKQKKILQYITQIYQGHL